MAVYAWNREEISEIARCLEKEAKKIVEQKGKLESYRKEVEANFQGDAAITFLTNMDADIAEASSVAESIQKQADLLRKISNEIYKNCEEELRQKLRVVQDYIR